MEDRKATIRKRKLKWYAHKSQQSFHCYEVPSQVKEEEEKAETEGKNGLTTSLSETGKSFTENKTLACNIDIMEGAVQHPHNHTRLWDF